LNTRVCDLNLRIKGSPLASFIDRLNDEFEQKLLVYRPAVYLTDTWGCPNEVPVLGIPFYLADRRLTRIEEEQTGDVEDEQMIMMYLRHEAGHAINYAYRLWESQGWTETFGRFTRPYRETFEPDPFTRQFVRHLVHSQYRWMYAQKHPDEDFAETFAVWLTPRSGWRRKYQNWPALRKLEYVDRLMRRIRSQAPVVQPGALLNAVDETTISLAAHYGQRIDRYRAQAQGYVDDKLRTAFPAVRGADLAHAYALLRSRNRDLLARVTRWSGLEEDDVRPILQKLQTRARALGLTFRKDQVEARLLDVTAMTTALATDFGYTGRLTG
jgi:hypothetical protein